VLVPFLLERYGHSTETDGDLKTNLNPLQLKNNTVAILKRCDLSAANKSGSSASRAVTSDNICGSVQITGGTDQVDGRNTKTADADASDAQMISPALKEQRAAATSDTDNESRFDNM